MLPQATIFPPCLKEGVRFQENGDSRLMPTMYASIILGELLAGLIAEE